MADQLQQQRDFWNREIAAFDAIYSRKKSRFSSFLDRVFRKDMYQRYEYTLRQAAPVEGRTFLDVGCGTGRYSLELARRKCARVVGIDIAEAMIAECKRLSSAEGLDARTEFLRSDLLDYRPSGTFDVSIGIGLFDYIKNPLPVLEKMRKLTSDRSIVSFPRVFTWRAPVRKVRLGLKGCDVYFYSRAQVERLLKDAGFSRLDVEKVGKLYCVTAHCRP
jgi:cyclopropane fatty-acyl-phospholipid synthase-like methyltransferase